MEAPRSEIPADNPLAGGGPEIAGPAMDLILGMSGRVGALDACEGEGLATLRERGGG